MADALGILLQISIILLFGALLSMIASKLKLPEILFFVLLGFGLRQFSIKVYPFLDLPFIFIATAALLTLALVVFEGSAHIKLHTLDILSVTTLKLVGMVTLFHMFLFTGAAWLAGHSLQQAALFAAIVAGTSAPVILMLLERTKGRIIEILRLESLMNTPVNAILPFLVLDLFYSGGQTGGIVAQLKPFLLKIFVGIGVGVLAGIILFKLFHHLYSKIYSPLAVLIAALLTYTLAEALGGNGVLGVMSLGLLFGNLYIKERGRMMEVQSVFARSVYILLFVLFGTLLSFPLTLSFLLKIAGLLAAYFAFRYLAVAIIMRNVATKEKLFMTLVSPNGVTSIAVAVVLAGMNVPGIAMLIQFLGAFLVGQLIVASAAIVFAPKMPVR